MTDPKTEYNKTNTNDENIYETKTKSQIETLKSSLGWSESFIVFTASCWDVLHAGHCLMLYDAKEQAQRRAKEAGKQNVIFVVGLHTDPTINRSAKNKPIMSLAERRILINSNVYVDQVIEYATESDLYNILQDLQPHLRVLGSDWEGKNYTGHDLQNIPVYFHKRDHPWSTSGLRKRIYEAEKEANATKL
jgi:glycerol-3-phosphate cytidylyltransferase